MDLLKMIAELQDERQRLDEAIEALERLSASSKNRRRGRPVGRGGRQTDHLSQADEKTPATFTTKDRKLDYSNP